MFDLSFPWSRLSWTGSVAPRLKAWSLDRNHDRTEGERLLKARSYVRAEEHLLRAAVDAEQRGHVVTKRIHIRLLLGEAQRKQFHAHHAEPDYLKIDAAEQTVRSAIELAARVNDSAAYVDCLDALGDIFAERGNYAAVEQVAQEAIRIGSQLPHADPIRMARRVHRVGVARQKEGRFGDAIPALEKAVAAHEAAFGENHSETGNQLTALGAVLRADGQHEAALTHLRRALEIHQSTRGRSSPEVIQDLYHMAGALEDSGELDGAAQQYEKALTLKLRGIGGDMEELAELQFGLATLYVQWQNYSRARELLTEAIGTFKRKSGVRLAISHETLAHVDEYSGRYHDAIKELEFAAKVWECQPDRRPEWLRNLQHRAELLEQLRRPGEAECLRETIAILTADEEDFVHGAVT